MSLGAAYRFASISGALPMSHVAAYRCASISGASPVSLVAAYRCASISGALTVSLSVVWGPQSTQLALLHRILPFYLSFIISFFFLLLLFFSFLTHPSFISPLFTYHPLLFSFFFLHPLLFRRQSPSFRHFYVTWPPFFAPSSILHPLSLTPHRPHPTHISLFVSLSLHPLFLSNHHLSINHLSLSVTLFLVTAQPAHMHICKYLHIILLSGLTHLIQSIQSLQCLLPRWQPLHFWQPISHCVNGQPILKLSLSNLAHTILTFA